MRAVLTKIRQRLVSINALRRSLGTARQPIEQSPSNVISPRYTYSHHPGRRRREQTGLPRIIKENGPMAIVAVSDYESHSQRPYGPLGMTFALWANN